MTDARNEELIQMANGLYLSIRGLTDNPREFMQIVSMLHLLLYLNHGDESYDLDTMLKEYSRNFKQNWASQKAHAQ